MKKTLRILPLAAALLLVALMLPSGAEGRSRGRSAQQERHERQEKKKARLSLAEHVHDFGQVDRRGGALHYEFAFTNTGTAPLVILRVQTSCSCLKGTFSRRPVQPGGSEVIRITYEPLKSEPGSFNKVIQVYSNSEGGRELLTVQGNARDDR